jgi:hypothetical protein
LFKIIKFIHQGLYFSPRIALSVLSIIEISKMKVLNNVPLESSCAIQLYSLTI